MNIASISSTSKFLSSMISKLSANLYSAIIFSLRACCRVISSSSCTLSLSYFFSFSTKILSSEFLALSSLDMIFLFYLSCDMTSSAVAIALSACSNLSIKWFINSSLSLGGYLSWSLLNLSFKALRSASASSSIAFICSSVKGSPSY